MNYKLLFILVCLFILSSCSTVANLRTDDVSNKYPVTNAANIEVHTLNVADRKYEVLGKVIASADAGSKSKTAVDMLKKEAAVLGADAVINMRLAIEYGYWANGITASGTAIKYSKN